MKNSQNNLMRKNSIIRSEDSMSIRNWFGLFKKKSKGDRTYEEFG